MCEYTSGLFWMFFNKHEQFGPTQVERWLLDAFFFQPCYKNVLDTFGPFWTVLEYLDSLGHLVQFKSPIGSFGQCRYFRTVWETTRHLVSLNSFRQFWEFRPGPYQYSTGSAGALVGWCWLFTIGLDGGQIYCRYQDTSIYFLKTLSCFCCTLIRTCVH